MAIVTITGNDIPGLGNGKIEFELPFESVKKVVKTGAEEYLYLLEKGEENDQNNKM